ncbi:MAG TPA: ATP-binding protein, partial [Cyclobacteriaceae bacterium]|nr:ATP-binding protein [Cyclobacteriaceae bacterium]
LNAPDLRLRCYSALVEIYEKSNADSTVKYQSLIIQINKETFNAKQAQQFQNIDFDEQQRLNEIETATKEVQAQLRTNILLGSTFTLVVIAFFLYRNSRTKQKAKKNIERAYDQLKATQSQLIQSEKMASLGELTAGIAHEIQNPLNFVNNFSEINTELIGEMKEALSKGDYESAKSIASSIDENERKIVLHGKRADGIVKGMLQHSRTSSGVKESTDINALADEYLRLAYHGIRAKDKSFTATMHTDFDSTIGNINIIPQDIGRVILNLITNAFYAVTEKSKQQPDSQSAGRPGYEPTVIVSTRKMDGKLIIAVKDNGNGIPGHIKDKIFQPFFTTKPTGQGTGLGLSMSYEIVTKTYGGQLKVETKEGEFAEFIITLPIS